MLQCAAVRHREPINQPTERATHLVKVATVMSRRLSPIIWGNILPGNSLLIGARCNYERKRAAGHVRHMSRGSRRSAISDSDLAMPKSFKDVASRPK